MRPGNVGEILRRAEGYLGQHGCDNPRLDAGLLLAHVLGVARIQLYVQHERFLQPGEIDAFRELVRRRGRREPVAYLTGCREFWSMSFHVDPRVLIPRPDTETILEAVEEQVPEPDRFADVGTGSGCLACALAGMYPHARGTAIDRDPRALEVAGRNLARLGFEEQVELCAGDLLEPLGSAEVDLVCANLPYVPSAELDGLPPDIRLYEPLAALDGGPDGLGPIRALVQQSPQRLAPEGALVIEVGEGQAGPVGDLCRRAGLADVTTRRDLAGTERVVVAKRAQV